MPGRPPSEDNVMGFNERRDFVQMLCALVYKRQLRDRIAVAKNLEIIADKAREPIVDKEDLGLLLGCDVFRDSDTLAVLFHLSVALANIVKVAPVLLVA